MIDYKKAITNIIVEQESIIGPIAIDIAKKVDNIIISTDIESLKIKGDPKQTLEKLVGEYSNIFGKVSIEVCKSVIRDLQNEFTQEEIPEILR